MPNRTKMKKIILLTGTELRHEFFRKYLGKSPELEVVGTYCESPMDSGKLTNHGGESDLRKKHLEARLQSEIDFFKLFNETCQDTSNPIFIHRGQINEPSVIENISSLAPDYIVSYGCSIIKPELINRFSGRFINLHLGLSPYYRGSGTNFWPLVNNQPEMVGATFMHIDEGIDTGEIIHQIRAKTSVFDNVHTIGNRLIKDAAKVIVKILVEGFEKSKSEGKNQHFVHEKVYKNKDFNEESVQKLYQNFQDGMIERYLENKELRDNEAPIQQNPRYLLD